MPIAGVVAGALCATVGWMVTTRGFRSTRQQQEVRRATDRALVHDCLANVDRVIDLPSLARAPVIDLRTFGSRDLDHLIDLSHVQPRHAPPTTQESAVILEPPSTWRAPTTRAPRSAAASA